MFDDIPPWVWIAVPIGVVILALVSKGSGGGSPYGAVTAYQPTPADPGLVSLAQSEVAAKSSAFGQLVSVFGATDISRIAAQRDTALETIQAGVSNTRTQAQLDAALAHESTSQLVGKYQTDAATAIAISANQTAANVASGAQATATNIAHIQAKATVGTTIVNGIKAIGSFFAAL